MITNVTQPSQDKSVLASQLFDYLYHEPLPIDEHGQQLQVALSTVSERDSVWDTHRVQAQIVELMYNHEQEFAKYAERVHDCSGWLKFGFNEHGLILKQAFFCRVRYCPVCQWRKSLYWKALMYQNLSKLREQYPTHRWLFLTLTVKNCLINELRSTINHMNKSWKRLMNRKEFLGVVDGWVRTTEVTRDTDNPTTHCHPHFHIILMVKPSYFGKGYVKHQQWVEIWQDCLQVDYLPVVDIRTVKPKGGNDVSYEYAIQSAIAETLKYSTKPSDMIQDFENPNSREWFYELTRQTHKLRFVATGGALKNALKLDDDIENQDLITVNQDQDDEENKTDERRLHFSYGRQIGKYVYNPKYNS